MAMQKLKDTIEQAETVQPAPAEAPAPAAAEPAERPAIKRARRGPKPSATPLVNNRAKARENKRAIVAHFSHDMHKAVNLLARELDETLQGAVGEALDDWLVKHGRKPFGER
jgi:hypothetical protein